MNLGITKKLIFFTLLFNNFIQPGNSSELYKINKDVKNQILNKGLTKILNNKKSSKFSFYKKYKKKSFQE